MRRGMRPRTAVGRRAKARNRLEGLSAYFNLRHDQATRPVAWFYVRRGPGPVRPVLPRTSPFSGCAGRWTSCLQGLSWCLHPMAFRTSAVCRYSCMPHCRSRHKPCYARAPKHRTIAPFLYRPWHHHRPCLQYLSSSWGSIRRPYLMASSVGMRQPVGQTFITCTYAGPWVSAAFFTFSIRSNGKLEHAVAT